MNPDILKPVAVLIAWSLVMWAWLYATRIPAVRGGKIALDPNALPHEFHGQLPPSVRWKADNYNHLMEQPTLFYAVSLLLATTGNGNGLNAMLAWAYVALRIVHSLVQATANIIMVRFTVFMLASLVLVMLTIGALGAVFLG